MKVEAILAVGSLLFATSLGTGLGLALGPGSNAAPVQLCTSGLSLLDSVTLPFPERAKVIASAEDTRVLLLGDGYVIDLKGSLGKFLSRVVAIDGRED